MICPLKFNSNTLNVDGVKSTYRDACRCEEKECAWWCVKDQKCAIPDIANGIYDIWADGIKNR